MGKPKCHKCNKFGHIAKDCNLNKPLQQVNYATQIEDARNLFYASHDSNGKKLSDVWYIDSRCSKHMTSIEDLLVDISKNVKAKVQLSIGVLVDVVGKGSLLRQ